MPEAEPVFEELGGVDRPLSFNDLIRQMADNLKIRTGEKGDKHFNPRGLSTSLVSGFGGPGLGLLSALPFSLMGKALKDILGFGKDNKFGVMDVFSNKLTAAGDTAAGDTAAPAGVGDEALSSLLFSDGSELSGQFSSQDNAALMAASGLPTDTLKIGPDSTQPSAVDLFTQLLAAQGFQSATGDPLNPNARTVAVGGGTNRSFDPFGGGAGPGAGRGGPGGTNFRDFFGGRFGRNVGNFGGGMNRGIGSNLFKF